MSEPTKALPLLMSGMNVRAILENRKSQTRRIILGDWEEIRALPNWKFEGRKKNGLWLPIKNPFPVGVPRWIKETWHPCCSYKIKPSEIEIGTHIMYRATSTTAAEGFTKWRPSLFMCRWMSRLTLDVTAVRAERLHDISREDAIAEGIESQIRPGYDRVYLNYLSGTFQYSSPTASYHSLWNKINGTGAWGKNPWVWVITFKKREEGEK
jgi:hypothetical protein